MQYIQDQVLTFESAECIIIMLMCDFQMRFYAVYVSLVLLIMLKKLIVPFKSVDKILT